MTTKENILRAEALREAAAEIDTEPWVKEWLLARADMIEGCAGRR